MSKKRGGDRSIEGIRPSGIKGTESTEQVRGTESVRETTGVQPAQSVRGIGDARSIGGTKRRPTRIMSFEEREQLMHMVQEEAEKIFKDSGMSEQRKRVVTDAVKLAIDSGLLPPEDEDKEK